MLVAWAFKSFQQGDLRPSEISSEWWVDGKIKFMTMQSTKRIQYETLITFCTKGV